MKLIIDIPDGIYQALKDNKIKRKVVADNIINAVINGKPYEEGMTFDYVHGYVDALNEDGEYKARPQGEWENDSDNLPICNKCGEIALQRIFVKMPHLIQDVRMVRSNYCPNCGADMRGGAE